jgi:hypothetical protein
MNLSIRRHFAEYLAPHPSTEMKEIFWATTIKNFALSMVGVFEPIFLFQIGFSIPQILVYYIISYGLYVLTAPLGARVCRKHGYEHSMLLSAPFLIIYYLALLMVGMSPAALVVAVIAITIRKTLYWPSYHANFATSMHKDEEGREVSTIGALSSVFTAFAPALGGLIVTLWGFSALFMAVSALILLSNVPLLRTPEVFVPTRFPYAEMLHRFFNRKAVRRFFAFFGYGEQIMATTLWPIFIAIVVPDLLAVGAVVSLAKVADVLMTLYVGRVSDDGGKRGLLRSGSFFTAMSWLVRPMVNGPLGIFLIDTSYGVAKNVLTVPFLSLLYEHAKDGDIMVRIVFAEMAISLGRVIASSIALAVFMFAPGDPWNAIFVLAAACSLLYALMPSSPTPKDAARIASPSMDAPRIVN